LQLWPELLRSAIMGEGEFIDQDFRRALMLSARVDVRSGRFENLADPKAAGMTIVKNSAPGIKIQSSLVIAFQFFGSTFT
jgi:hypothetical protein